jgi:hypothetical protein
MKFVRVLVQSYWIPGFLPESGRNRWRSVKSSTVLGNRWLDLFENVVKWKGLDGNLNG